MYHHAPMPSATLGLDFGTNSVRALIVRCSDAEELGSYVFNYPSGNQGVFLDPNEPHLARQNPLDYLEGIEKSIRGAIQEAQHKHADFSPNDIIGIGVDATGSSPLPVDSQNRSLVQTSVWKDHLAAHCWLWKDHTSFWEAAKITEIAREKRPQYVAKCGNTYSSEWFWSKIWHCLRTEPKVFDAAYSWVELTDWIPSVLAGVTDPKKIQRGICCAGHKALYAEDWNGLPDKEFLSLLDPKLAALRDRLYDTAKDASHPAGFLSPSWAKTLNLKEGIPIAIGEMDVHYGAIACGVEDGTLVKVIGTSTCDCSVVKADKVIADIPGICGIVKGAILPGYYGIEAGQSAVGDIFKWWVEGVCKGDEALHAELTQEASQLKPGQSGLLALDWNSGNRTVLINPRLTGLILGQTLHTTRAEIYRALIEATAFGARIILDRLDEYKVPVNKVVCAGGIAEKNPLLMQIYADVFGREMLVTRSSQACALGSAISAAVLAGPEKGGHASFSDAQKAMTGVKSISYKPRPENVKIYTKIFTLYKKTHDAFGNVSTVDLGTVMEELLTLAESQRA